MFLKISRAIEMIAGEVANIVKKIKHLNSLDI